MTVNICRQVDGFCSVFLLGLGDDSLLSCSDSLLFDAGSSLSFSILE